MLTILFIMQMVSATELPTLTVYGSKEDRDSAELQVVVPSEEQRLAHPLSMLPNLTFANGANRPRFFQIRGVGETSQFEHSQVGALGIFYEGIDLSEEASALPLSGGETLSALYGPQSLKWGGKALAGSLEVTSCLDRPCAPTRFEVGVGTFGSRSFSGRHLQAGERLSFLGSARAHASEGFYQNAYLHRATGRQDEKEAVIGLSYRLGDFKFREHHLFSRNNNGYDAWSFEPSFQTISDRPGRDFHQVHGHSLQWQAGELFRFRGLTSVTVTQQVESYDEDWGNNTYWNDVPGWNQDYDYFAEFERRRLKFHQSLYLRLPSGSEIGAHFYTYGEDQIIRSFKDGYLRRSSEPQFFTRHLAGTWTHELDFKKWIWSFGARAEGQNISLEGIGPNRSKQISPQWSGDLRATRVWNEDLSTELRLQRGFRGAGYNTTAGVADDSVAFSPEQLYLAQLSTQGKTSDAWVRGRVFYQWQEHQQARNSFQSDPMDPNTFSYFTANISGSRSWGFETTALRRWGPWALTANLGLMKSEFRSYVLAGRNLLGRALAQTPPWNYSLRLEFVRDTWNVFAQLSGRDGYFYSVDHDFKSSPYHLGDVGVSIRLARVELRAIVKNFANQRYPVRAFYFANEPPAWNPKFYTQLGDPRTFGLQLSWEI